MSTSYSTREGDTFDTVARIKYGSQARANFLRQANPGVVEPFRAGLVLNIPPDPTAPKNTLQQTTFENSDSVAIRVDGKQFNRWSQIIILDSIDSFSTFRLMAPFNSDDTEIRGVLVPMSFKSVEVLVGGLQRFTGTMVQVAPDVSPAGKVIVAEGYSTPGVLGDCTPSIESYPLEFKNKKFSQIAKRLCDPFGIKVIIDGAEGSTYLKVSIEPTAKIFSFLVKIAQQRGLVLTNNENGDLVAQNSKPAASPVAVLEESKPPLLSVSPSFNPQNYFSHITCLGSASSGRKGASFTFPNSKLNAPIRPLSFKAPDTLGANLEATTKAKMGRMFGDVVTYRAELATWRDPNGELWAPNTTISLEAPDAMIYKATLFLIKRVSFTKSDTLKKAALTLVLPGAYSGEIPEVLPWDE